MAKGIQLTPEVLRSQAGQMDNLKNEYESLFANVTTILNNVNHNWSDNLANNFSLKIQSAQKSFSSILDTLEFGRDAALKSSLAFEETDKALEKALMDPAGNQSLTPLPTPIMDPTKPSKKRDKGKEALKYLLNGGKEFVSGIANIYMMPYDLITEGPVAFASDGYQLINGMFATGSSLTALCFVGMSCFGKDGDFWSEGMLKEADRYGSMGGMTDLFEDAGFKTLSKVTRTADAVSDAYDLTSDLTSLAKNAKKIISPKDHADWLNLITGLKTNTSVDALYLKHFPDEAAAKSMLKLSNQSSNVSKITKYLDKIVSGDDLGESAGNLGKELLTNNHIYKSYKDLESILENISTEVR